MNKLKLLLAAGGAIGGGYFLYKAAEGFSAYTMLRLLSDREDSKVVLKHLEHLYRLRDYDERIQYFKEQGFGDFWSGVLAKSEYYRQPMTFQEFQEMKQKAKEEADAKQKETEEDADIKMEVYSAYVGRGDEAVGYIDYTSLSHLLVDLYNDDLIESSKIFDARAHFNVSDADYEYTIVPGGRYERATKVTIRVNYVTKELYDKMSNREYTRKHKIGLNHESYDTDASKAHTSEYYVGSGPRPILHKRQYHLKVVTDISNEKSFDMSKYESLSALCAYLYDEGLINDYEARDIFNFYHDNDDAEYKLEDDERLIHISSVIE